MKERPIIARGHEVRAIMDGRQTQMRRVMKSQPPEIANNGDWYADRYNEGAEWCWWGKRGTAVQNKCLHHVGQKCPYGQPGCILWVRETYSLTNHGKPVYRADGKDRDGFQWAIEPGDPRRECLWKSSGCMPRRASRITLELVNARVERVQDISEADAKAEGCSPLGDDIARLYTLGYMHLWGQINGPGSWAANQWVWVLEFKRVQP